jgi:hypothetical protein
VAKEGCDHFRPHPSQGCCATQIHAGENTPQYLETEFIYIHPLEAGQSVSNKPKNSSTTSSTMKALFNGAICLVTMNTDVGYNPAAQRRRQSVWYGGGSFEGFCA